MSFSNKSLSWQRCVRHLAQIVRFWERERDWKERLRKGTLNRRLRVKEWKKKSSKIWFLKSKREIAPEWNIKDWYKGMMLHLPYQPIALWQQFVLHLEVYADRKGKTEKTSLYKQRCGFSMQFSFQHFFHRMDVICFDWIGPSISHWFHLILQWILQFLQSGFRRVDGWMDKQVDRIMDRQTKWWADRPLNGWTCNMCA